VFKWPGKRTQKARKQSDTRHPAPDEREQMDSADPLQESAVTDDVVKEEYLTEETIIFAAEEEAAPAAGEDTLGELATQLTPADDPEFDSRNWAFITPEEQAALRQQVFFAPEWALQAPSSRWPAELALRDSSLLTVTPWRSPT